MALALGTRLGSYEVVAQIGVGGMGEVYRATDTKLKRQVALKILPTSLATDADRLVRFQREAEVLASLNHPNIAAIYGLEESGGVTALVMELVEGNDLSQRIARGAIPLDEALSIATQIAEALEAAHEQGIIHRDLKPANIKVRPDDTVKVLDFGLAKAMEPVAGPLPSLSMSPTIATPAMTHAGMILGTAAYMSPEQARGRPVDRRADIWAFGCVLFEMLSGTQAFAGDTVSDVIVAILAGEPDWTTLPAATPAPLVKLMRRCLEKDRKRRLRDAGDALYELREAVASTTAEQPAAATATAPAGPRRGGAHWLRPVLAVAGLVIVCALTGVSAWRMKPVPATSVTRFALTLPPDQQFTGTLGQMVALSADGTHLAYVANNRLYARAMSESDARPIAGTEAVAVRSVLNFAVSPDGQSIAFLSDGALKKIPVNGGAATTICPLPAASGLSWGPAGILFVAPGGIMRVSPDGGTPERIATVADGQEIVQGPQMLPDGHTLLFSVAAVAGDVSSRWDMGDIVVQSVPGGQRRTVIHGGSNARYVATGHLVYAMGGDLLAVPFDAAKQQVMGAATTVIEGVRRALSTQIAQFSVSDSGSLVYVPGPAGQAIARRYQLAVVSLGGEITRLPVPDGPYEFPRFSSDGTRIAFDTDDGKDANIWVSELSGASAMRRLTFGGRNRHPIWSRDDRWITFQSDRLGDLSLFRQRADGTGAAERLTKAEPGTAHVPQSWSPSGEQLLYTVNKGGVLEAWTGAENRGMSSTLLLLSLKDLKTEPFAGVETRDRAVNAEFSPDGAWVAYSLGTKPTVIYVQPFPLTGAVFQLSKDDDGHHPWWSRDGRELFYVPGPDGLVRVSVTTRPSYSVSSPVAIPRGGLIESPVTSRNIDISPDGKTMIGVAAAGQATPGSTGVSEMQVVLNWFEELKARVPTK